MMSDFGYDGLSEHHRSHLLIVSEVNDYLKSIVRNDEEPRVNLWPHVRTTLRHHMQKFDTDFAHYLEQRTARDAAGPVAATPRPPLGALT
jgi:hemerythrin